MIPFVEYMEQALYGPAGYYSTGAAKSGKTGDYFTAPDVGEAFGVLLAEVFADWQKRLNAAAFRVVEAGPGEGRLAKDILARHPFAYTAVEKSASRRQVLESLRPAHPTFSVASDLMSLQPFEGVLFGNELIDAFPVHRVQFSGGALKELYYDEKEGKRKFLWKPASTPQLSAYFARLGIALPDRYETEVNLAMKDWLADAARVLTRGLVLLIDYGRPAHEYYAPERTRGTLRAFSKHRVSADFLDPGSMVDLTADVDFTSLALDARDVGFVPLGFMEMGSFLLSGAALLQETTAPRGLKYLIHPDGMGAQFHVLILGKGIDPAAWPIEFNRLKRLGLPA